MESSSLTTPLDRIGHRGAPQQVLENTLPSFERAVELGATAVELDVHVTADGVPVVHHDAGLGRSVVPARLARREIARLTLAEAESVDLGAGARIPRLDAVLAAMAGRAFVYVEIKAGAEAPVVAVIRASKAQCAMHSFDHDAIARVRELAPEIPRGILFDRSVRDWAAEAERTGARDIWPAERLVTAGLVRAIHDAGGRVIPWTVNSRRGVTRMRAAGVDGICTNDLSLLSD